MKKHLFFVLILASVLVFGQRPQGSGQRPGDPPPTGTISGTLTDESGSQMLEFATIALYNAQDSSLVGGGISDAKGKFSFQSRPGKYYLKMNFVGYGEAIISDISVSRDNMQVDVGKVALGASTLNLDELTIQADRTQMELQLDKKVYNIGKDLSNLGGNAADLLGNLPSVDVDVEGNVSLRGSENVQILIDGRPSGLIGLSGTGGLQQMQGTLIEKVEIITNPSARYDAEGGAGIINIVLKKEKAKGFNGSFQVQTGYPANHGATVNVNYRTGWINWFVNYGASFRRTPGEGFNNIYYTDSDTFLDQINDRTREGLSHNLRFGSDIYLNDTNVITLATSYRLSDNDNLTDVRYDDFDGNRDLTSSSKRLNDEVEEDLNRQYSIRYNRDFKRRGQKFTIDGRYQNNSEAESSGIQEFDFPIDPIAELVQRTNNDNGEKRTIAKMDYVHPFSTSGKLETGLSYSYRNIFNDYLVETEYTPGVFIEETDFTNDFNFKENVSASYLILSNQVNNITWQLGSRLEHTKLVTLLEQTDEKNKQNYLSFFPSAHFTYKLTEGTSFQVSYSRRISRPRFRSLNPFTSLSDRRNIYSGNPNLKPQFTNSYELGVLTNKEKGTFYYGIYHRYTTDVVQRIQTIQDDITFRRPENLSTRSDIGIELNVSRDFTKKFRTTGTFNFYNSRTEGLDLSAETTTFSFRLGNNYTNSKLFNAQLNMRYRAPQNTTQGKRFGILSVDTGLSKDVLKKNGTISINVRDLFNTRKYRGETITENFTSNSEFQWRRGPTVNVSFTYRINQRKQRQRSGGRGDGGEGEFEGEF